MSVKQTTPEASQKQEQPIERVLTPVEKPTVGRIVHFNVAGFGQEPVLRPAIVLETGMFGHADGVRLAVFVAASDFPLPPGVGLKRPDVGTRSYPAHAGWEKECAGYGDGPGQWVWPTRGEPETFDVAA
jgi:hypothetical protein